MGSCSAENMTGLTEKLPHSGDDHVWRHIAERLGAFYCVGHAVSHFNVGQRSGTLVEEERRSRTPRQAVAPYIRRGSQSYVALAWAYSPAHLMLSLGPRGLQCCKVA
jgi:hypothetical protein